MIRLLYIGLRVEKATDGGTAGQKNIENMLRTLFSSRFFSLYVNEKAVGGFAKVWSYLECMPNAAVSTLKKRTAECIRENAVNTAFLCSSLYGVIAGFIKRNFPHVVIVSFFHNVERLYARDYLKLQNPKSWYFYLYSLIAERVAVRCSDYCLNINQRDALELLRLYGRKSDCIIPYSMKNVFSPEQIAYKKAHKKKLENHRALFVGSAFFGNTQGLDWFISAVLPALPITLVIVGNGMDRLYHDSEKIEVHGFVDDLGAYYEDADFVLLPIISGSGMKTKTAEAMMYGKVIVGTKEAFSGYETEGVDGLFCCDTLDDFKKTVHALYEKDFFNFNENIHKHFCTCYDADIARSKLADFFQSNIGGGL